MATEPPVNQCQEKCQENEAKTVRDGQVQPFHRFSHPGGAKRIHPDEHRVNDKIHREQSKSVAGISANRCRRLLLHRPARTMIQSAHRFPYRSTKVQEARLTTSPPQRHSPLTSNSPFGESPRGLNAGRTDRFALGRISKDSKDGDAGGATSLNFTPHFSTSSRNQTPSSTIRWVTHPCELFVEKVVWA